MTVTAAAGFAIRALVLVGIAGVLLTLWGVLVLVDFHHAIRKIRDSHARARSRWEGELTAGSVRAIAAGAVVIGIVWMVVLLGR